MAESDFQFQNIPVHNPIVRGQSSSLPNINPFARSGVASTLPNIGPSTQQANYPNFNPADPSTFVNLPGGPNSLGPAVNLSESLHGTAADNSPKLPGTDLLPFINAGANLYGLSLQREQIKLNKRAQDLRERGTRLNAANQAKVTNAATQDRVRAGAVQRGERIANLDGAVASQSRDRLISGVL